MKRIVQNRNFIGLLSANTILAAAFPIQLILGGLTGLLLAPTPTLATLPSSVQTLSALIAAAPFSIMMGRFGRRVGFAIGAVLTLVGAGIAMQALYAQSFTLLCVGHFLMGAGWASFQYFRFAAGEVVDTSLRPVAISLVLTSGLVAAIVGPQLYILAQDALTPIPLAGAYAVLTILSMLGVLPLLTVRIPLPEKSLKQDARHHRSAALAALRRRPIQRAVAIAAAAQGIMVFLWCQHRSR